MSLLQPRYRPQDAAMDAHLGDDALAAKLMMLRKTLILFKSWRAGKDDLPELAGEEQLRLPVLEIAQGHIETQADCDAFVQSPEHADDDLTVAVVVDEFKLADVASVLQPVQELGDDLAARLDYDLPRLSAFVIAFRASHKTKASTMWKGQNRPNRFCDFLFRKRSWSGGRATGKWRSRDSSQQFLFLFQFTCVIQSSFPRQFLTSRNVSGDVITMPHQLPSLICFEEVVDPPRNL
jgi:hypothetical protein